METLGVIVGILAISLSLSILIGDLLKRYPKRKVLKVRSIGHYRVGNKTYVLPHYFVDKQDNLYSVNPHTWETDPKRGRLLKCSDLSISGENIVNSLRTPLGTKVTIARNKISFNRLNTSIVNLIVEVKDERHFDIKNLDAISFWS